MIGALVLLLPLAGCGGPGAPESTAKPTAQPSYAERAVSQMEQRLRSAGYAVAVQPTPLKSTSPPKRVLIVRDVDYVSSHTFSVAVFFFRMDSQAAHFRRIITNSIRLDERGFNAQRHDYEVRAQGQVVYFGFTSMDPDLCRPVGLCATFANYGPVPVCEGKSCQGGPEPLPPRDFDKVLSASARSTSAAR